MSTVSKMPTSVVVGAHKYAVRRVKIRGDGHGQCDFDKLEIQVHKPMKRDKAQEILVHELLHACTYPAVTGKGLLDEEAFVENVAPLLLQVIRDNPDLMRYLTS